MDIAQYHKLKVGTIVLSKWGELFEIIEDVEEGKIESFRKARSLSDEERSGYLSTEDVAKVIKSKVELAAYLV